jgi:PadR family transcriptional regulator PadR
MPRASSHASVRKARPLPRRTRAHGSPLAPIEPLHGYALATRIQQRSRDLLQVEEGSLYPALQRLLKAGLVDARWQTSQTNRRVRTYSLTTKGRKHLARETAAFDQMIEGIQFVLDSE